MLLLLSVSAMSAAYDPLGLGIAGIGYGGFAEGYSVNGVDLTRGSAGQRSADGSTSSYKAATPRSGANC